MITVPLDEPELLSLRETALLSGTSEKSIRNDLAARTVRAVRGGTQRRFHAIAVVYFSLINELPVELDRAKRKQLFELLANGLESVGPWRWEAGRLVLDGGVPLLLRADHVVERAEKRVAAFLRSRARVVSDPEILSGEPVFAGTRVSVRFVGGRARNGESLSDLLEDYPALTRSDIEFASIHVALGPAPRRPRKLGFARGSA